MSKRATSNPWNTINYHLAYGHYYDRFTVHQRLVRAFQERDIPKYVELALGIDEPTGNYSAAEHGLGPRILQQSSQRMVFELAQKLFICEEPAKIPEIIYKMNLPYLKISVGSEMAALLRPDVFWVTNVRTIWAHLVVKHNNNVELANEELRYYRTQDLPSEMNYQLWREIHPLVGDSMAWLAQIGNSLSEEQGIEHGNLRFLWADAIADIAYNEYSK